MPSGFSDGVDNTNGGIGAGATGRVAVYDSASSVTGYSGLTYSASNLSVGGGLNVGSASGAAAGEIRTSSSLVPGTGTRIKAFQFTLANGANVQIVSDEAKPNAVVLVMNISDANAAQYYLRGGWNGVAEMSDYAGDFSPTSGNAGTTNIYYDTGTTSYRLQNNNGTPMWYNVIVFDVLQAPSRPRRGCLEAAPLVGRARSSSLGALGTFRVLRVSCVLSLPLPPTTQFS
jgi:hypothetical protein